MPKTRPTRIIIESHYSCQRPLKDVIIPVLRTETERNILSSGRIPDQNYFPAADKFRRPA